MKRRIFDLGSVFIYLFASIVLSLMAFIIMGWSIMEVYEFIVTSESLHDGLIPSMLKYVGAIVIAIAILDISKYMVEEEIFRTKDKDFLLKESRENLTRIIKVIIIAICMESLVYIFKSGSGNLSDLLYPSLLILSDVALIVGLGIYQKLSISSEREEKEL